MKFDIPYKLVEGAKKRQLAPVEPALALLALHAETSDICRIYYLYVEGALNTISRVRADSNLDLSPGDRVPSHQLGR